MIHSAFPLTGPPAPALSMLADQQSWLEIVARPTRSFVQDVALTTPHRERAPDRTWIDAFGRVHWLWRVPRYIENDAMVLRLRSIGERPSVLFHTWSAAAPEYVEPASLSMQRTARAEWFEYRARVIRGDPAMPLDVKQARLFFLDMDKVTSPGHLRSLVSPGAPDDTVDAIESRCRQIEGALRELLRRLFWRRYAGRDKCAGIRPTDATVRGLSELLLALVQRHFAPGGHGLDMWFVERAFLLFAAGEISDRYALSNCGPDSAFVFLFAEFADIAIELRVDGYELWLELLPTLVGAQRLFIQAHGPPPRPFTAYGDRRTAILPESSWRSTMRIRGRSHAELRAEMDLIAREAFTSWP